jgi:hypothetical protein
LGHAAVRVGHRDLQVLGVRTYITEEPIEQPTDSGEADEGKPDVAGYVGLWKKLYSPYPSPPRAVSPIAANSYRAWAYPASVIPPNRHTPASVTARRKTPATAPTPAWAPW